MKKSTTLAERIKQSPFYELNTSGSSWQDYIVIDTLRSTSAVDALETAADGQPIIDYATWKKRFPRIHPLNVIFRAPNKGNIRMYYFEQSADGRSATGVFFPLHIVDGNPCVPGIKSDAEYEEKVLEFASMMNDLVCMQEDFRTFFRFDDPIGDGTCLMESFKILLAHEGLPKDKLYNTFFEGIDIYPAWERMTLFDEEISKMLLDAKNTAQRYRTLAMLDGRENVCIYYGHPPTPIGKSWEFPANPSGARTNKADMFRGILQPVTKWNSKDEWPPYYIALSIPADFILDFNDDGKKAILTADSLPSIRYEMMSNKHELLHPGEELKDFLWHTKKPWHRAPYYGDYAQKIVPTVNRFRFAISALYDDEDVSAAKAHEDCTDALRTAFLTAMLYEKLIGEYGLPVSKAFIKQPKIEHNAFYATVLASILRTITLHNADLDMEDAYSVACSAIEMLSWDFADAFPDESTLLIRELSIRIVTWSYMDDFHDLQGALTATVPDTEKTHQDLRGINKIIVNSGIEIARGCKSKIANLVAIGAIALRDAEAMMDMVYEVYPDQLPMTTAGEELLPCAYALQSDTFLREMLASTAS